MQGAPHISADRLSDWACEYATAGDLPWLVRSLVRLTVGPQADVEFSTGKGIYGGDFDGTVASAGRGKVPDGDSVWEVSTCEDFERKANEDYVKRTANPKGRAQHETTYVGVTLRRFSKCKEWAEQRRSEGKWADVRFYDAEVLSEWLDQHAVLRFQLATKLRIESGARSLPDWWINLNSQCTKRAVGDDWMLSGREAEGKLLIARLSGTGKWHAISGVSQSDALAFLYSSVASIEDTGIREDLFCRMLYVSSETVLNGVGATARNALLIPACDLSLNHAGLVDPSNTIIYCGVPDPHEESVALGPIRSGKLADKLKRDGVPFEEIERYTAAARNGFSVLREVLGAPPTPFDLVGIDPRDYGILTALLLANRWSEDQPADLEFLAVLAARNVAEIEGVCTRLLQGEHPLLRRSGRVTFITDDLKAWREAASLAQPSVIERFREACPRALVEDEAAFDKASNVTFMSGLLGRQQTQSHHLKSGLARTLTALSILDLSLGSVGRGKMLADGIVRDCLSELTPQRWSALAPTLSLLAEASPMSFLDALEADLGLPSPAIRSNSEGESSIPFYGSHNEVLWALERLAWHGDLLSRVTSCLGAIDELGTKANSGNSALGSLREIFVPWSPCTDANLVQRIDALEALAAEHPHTYWGLLKSLLPKDHGVSRQTSRPQFRAWGTTILDRSSDEFWDDLSGFNEYAVKEAVEAAGEDAERLAELVSVYARYPLDYMELLLDRLRAVGPNFNVRGRKVVWTTMRETFARHRRHPGFDWSMGDKEAKAFESTMALLEPTDPVTVHLWLFRGWVDFPDDEVDFDYEARTRRVLEARDRAVREIFQSGGDVAVLELAEQSEEPGYVGQSAERIGLWTGAGEDAFLQRFLGSEVRWQSNLARGFAGSRAFRLGADWVLSKLSETNRWSAAQRTAFFFMLPNRSATWEKLEEEVPEVVAAYWQRIAPWSLETTEEAEVLQFGLHFLERGRRADLAHWLWAKTAGQSLDIPVQLIVDTLSALTNSPWTDEEAGKIHGHGLDRLVEILVGDARVDQRLVAKFEFLLMEVMPYGYRPKALAREMEQSTDFFLELLDLAFPEDFDSRNDVTDDERAFAHQVYVAMKSSLALPGRTDLGIDGDYLMRWTKDVREGAAAIDRLRMADYVMGEWFANSPSAEDAWPMVEVCKAIQAAASDTLDNHVVVGHRNARGVTSRSLDAGGDQERTLADKYRAYSRARARYPRVVKILTRLAESYDWEAQRYDERAEMEQDL